LWIKAPHPRAQDVVGRARPNRRRDCRSVSAWWQRRIAKHSAARSPIHVAKENTMRVGFLGTGRVATAVGSALAAGHDVVLGSRTPQGRELEPPVVGLREAAAHGEVVVNATPRTAQ
jgi:phosphoglycerate dehydrogenase-like enzyme